MKLSIFCFTVHRFHLGGRVGWVVPHVSALFAAVMLLHAVGASAATGDGLPHLHVEVSAEPLLLSGGDRFRITGYPKAAKVQNLASPDGPVLFDLYATRDDGLHFDDPLNSKDYFFLHIEDSVKRVDHRLVLALTQTSCSLLTLAMGAIQVVPGRALEVSILKNYLDEQYSPLVTSPEKVCISAKSAIEVVFLPLQSGFLPLIFNVGNGEDKPVVYAVSIPL